MAHSMQTGQHPRQQQERGEAPPRRRPVALGVVDTVPLFRDGVTALIDKTPWMNVAAHAASQQGAIQMAEQAKPDVMLVDSCLDPRCHLTHALASTTPPMRVVVLVREANRNSGYLAAVMSAGAHGATPRNAEPQRILDAIRHATSARRYLDPSLANLVTQPQPGEPAQHTQNGHKDGDGASPAPALLHLSRREFQVLQLVAEGLENAAIAKVLFLSAETVRTHVKSILRKLAARDRTHAVTIAFRSGLLSISTDASTESTAASLAPSPAAGVADTHHGSTGGTSRTARDASLSGGA